MVALSNTPAMINTPPPLIPPLSSTGYSFSPGGLLFPYHLGAITSLGHHGRLDDSTHLAGASAGAIAVASHASKTPPEKSLEGAIKVCEECESRFGGKAVGNLLPLLKVVLEEHFSEDAHTVINERKGITALAHRELFPNNRPVLMTQFDTKDDLIEAVCDSSMFPFFSTPFPVRLRYKEGERIPRVVVDGFFTVPRERYGCPDFAHLNFDNRIEEKLRSMGGVLVDENQTNDNNNDQSNNNPYGEDNEIPIIERTITVACFPHETVGLTASVKHDQISPEPDFDDPVGQMQELFRYATKPSSRKELEGLYERGWADAEKWNYEEECREKKLMEDWLKERSMEEEVEEALKRGNLF